MGLEANMVFELPLWRMIYQGRAGTRGLSNTRLYPVSLNGRLIIFQSAGSVAAREFLTICIQVETGSVNGAREIVDEGGAMAQTEQEGGGLTLAFHNQDFTFSTSLT